MKNKTQRGFSARLNVFSTRRRVIIMKKNTIQSKQSKGKYTPSTETWTSPNIFLQEPFKPDFREVTNLFWISRASERSLLLSLAQLSAKNNVQNIELPIVQTYKEE